MFANAQMMGTDLAFPDVCQTPSPPAQPVPIPYPNIGNGSTGIPTAYNVLFMGTPAHDTATTIPLTNGDEAGVVTGSASGTVMGPSRHLSGSVTVLLNGIPATRMSSSSQQNSTNSAGARLVPSQTLVMILAP